MNSSETSSGRGRRTIQREVDNRLSRMILDGQIQPGQQVTVGAADGQLTFGVDAPAAAADG